MLSPVRLFTPAGGIALFYSVEPSKNDLLGDENHFRKLSPAPTCYFLCNGFFRHPTDVPLTCSMKLMEIAIYPAVPSDELPFRPILGPRLAYAMTAGYRYRLTKGAPK